MSRERAVQLIESLGWDVGSLPLADTDLTWWTMAATIGIEASTVLSAMEQLAPERWVLASATPMLAQFSAQGNPRQLVLVFRRISLDEIRARSMQNQPVILQPPPGRN